MNSINKIFSISSYLGYQRLRGRRRSAFTLVEVLVATAGALVISGIALGLYEQSARATRKLMARHEALETGQRALDAIARELRGAVRPSALDDSADLQPTFAPNKIEAFRVGPGGALQRRTIEAPEAGGVVVSFASAAAENPASAPPSAETPSQPPIKYDPANLTASVRFRFATIVRPGQPVQYADAPPAGQWPALVEMVYEGRTPAPDSETVTLRTAVVLGAVGGSL